MDQHADDERILAMLASGVPELEDRGARQLLETHGPLCLGKLRVALNGPRELLEEALMRALTSLWRAADRYDASNLPGLLFTIARNHAVDRFRLESARVPESMDADFSEPGGAEGGDGAVQADLVAVSARLSRRSQIIVLRDIEAGGRESSEVLAKLLGISVGAVYTARRRAWAELREMMRREGYGPDQ